MTKNALAVVAAVLGVFMATVQMFAHHATVRYDSKKTVTFKGTVTEYRFVNPHVLIYFDVQDENGNLQNWSAESGPPQRVFRAGWSKDALKVGDQITVTGNPSKSGEHALSIRTLIAPDGKSLTQGAE